MKPDHTEQPRKIQCAFSHCYEPAICRVKKPTGWANLCLQHYTDDNLKESREYCRRHGLDTVQKKIDHTMALLKAPRDFRAWMINPKSAIACKYAYEVTGEKRCERQPGEDEE